MIEHHQAVLLDGPPRLLISTYVTYAPGQVLPGLQQSFPLPAPTPEHAAPVLAEQGWRARHWTPMPRTAEHPTLAVTDLDPRPVLQAWVGH